jgi:branched-subunit amino acid transport protein
MVLGLLEVGRRDVHPTPRPVEHPGRRHHRPRHSTELTVDDVGNEQLVRREVLLPDGVRRGLAHLAPAVLAALVAVELLEISKESSPLVILFMLDKVAMVAVVVKLTRNMTVAVALALGAALAIDLAVLA